MLARPFIEFVHPGDQAATADALRRLNEDVPVAAEAVPEREATYPDPTMFGVLPACGFYCRHVRGLKFQYLQLATAKPNLRHAMLFEDV